MQKSELHTFMAVTPDGVSDQLHGPTSYIPFGEKAPWAQQPTGRICHSLGRETKNQTPWPLVSKRTLPTERPPLVDKI
jgi:hypothetical protein